MNKNPFKIKFDAIKDRYVKGFNRHETEGDNLLFMPHFSGWLGKSVQQKKVIAFHIFFLLLLGVLLVRISYLQVIEGKTFFALAEQNRLKVVPLYAPRGVIFDRYEEALVENIPRFMILIDPKLIQTDAQAEDLKNYLLSTFINEQETIRGFFSTYRENRVEQLLVDNLTYDDAIRLFIASSQYAALKVAYEPRRNYLHSDSLGHVLGYVGRMTMEELNQYPDYKIHSRIGKTGVEKYYEDLLRGMDGYVTYEVDAFGREKIEVTRENPHRGTDIILTIDLEVQQMLYKILSRITEQYRKPGAAGIILNPQSGEILALVSYPAYDPNIFTSTLMPKEFATLVQDPRKPFFNRVVSGEYPAGSIFKLVVAAAALDEHIIDEQFQVISTGGLYLGDRFFPDWKAGGHGETSILKAIAESVNTFFYITGGGYENFPGLGSDMIVAYAERLGYGTVTNIDLPHESTGFLPSRKWKEDRGEHWYQGDTYNLAIGQGSLTVTPLQVASVMSFFANQGNVIRPYIMKQSLVSPESTTSNRTPGKAQIEASTIDIIRRGLRQAVLNGTAQRLQSIGMAIAGKTGTAQFNQNKPPHSWFSGFAPYNSPELVLTILIEEGGDYNLALDAAQEFFSTYYRSDQ